MKKHRKRCPRCKEAKEENPNWKIGYLERRVYAGGWFIETCTNPSCNYLKTGFEKKRK